MFSSFNVIRINQISKNLMFTTLLSLLCYQHLSKISRSIIIEQKICLKCKGRVTLILQLKKKKKHS